MLTALRPLRAARFPLSALLLMVGSGCSGPERSLGEAIGLGRGGRSGSDATDASSGGTGNSMDLGGAAHGGTPEANGTGADSNDAGTSSGGTNGGAGSQTTAGTAGDLGSETGGASSARGGTPATGSGGSLNATGGVATTGGSAALGGASGANNGGASSMGGKAASGGTLATGGASSSGGKAASGGTLATGGASSSGGKAASGGTLATGGTPATGGTQATGGSETIGGCDRQLLANAEFDQGPTATWVETSTWPGVHIVTNRNDAKLKAEAVTPYSGDYLAWLGGIPDNQYDHHTLILTQKVAIPADAATLTLSGRRWVKTVEDASEVFDEAYLEFEGLDETVAWQALWLTNRDLTSGWVAFEASTDGLDAVRGKTITFVAYSRTDPTGMTSFFLDSLRLVATCGR